MPLYEYRCDVCGQRFEVIRKFSDPPLEVCTACGKGPITRLQSSPAIQFKGSGWYITDYAQKGKSEKGGSSGGGKSEGGGKSDSAKGDSAKSDSAGKTEKTDSSSKSETPAPSTASSSTGTKD